MDERVKRITITDALIETVKQATTHGEVLTLKYRPLDSGTDRWELVNENGKTIIGSLDKQELFDATKGLGVKVAEEENGHEKSS